MRNAGLEEAQTGIKIGIKMLAFLIRWPKYWSFSFNISPSNEHPGLISFRMDLLPAQGLTCDLKELIL